MGEVPVLGTVEFFCCAEIQKLELVQQGRPSSIRPLVRKNIRKMTMEFVDVPINSMVDLSSSLCKRLPGRVKPPEIVDLPGFTYRKW